LWSFLGFAFLLASQQSCRVFAGDRAVGPSLESRSPSESP
jgi:hypothetical protein